ncbi:MAG TPA: YkvA family protein [Marinilabiliaceae bacterium]|mgnify:FL=1|nr:YkvA family protein [Marinilabiliaceae bacterium]
MENKFTDEMLESQISKNTKEAEELLKDEDRMERFLERLERKLEKVPVVGKQLSNIPMLVSLVRSYIRKDYRDVPLGSIIAIVSALIYFLSQIDLLPDSIPVLGYVDDAAVFAFVWKMVADDIEEYRKWQEANGKRIFKD